MIRIEHRRRSVRATFLEDAFGAAKRSLIGTVGQALRESVQDMLKWSLGRLVSFLVAAALFVTAAILLLTSIVEGLKEASFPASVAYLIPGLVGLVVGFLLLRKADK